MIRKRILGGVVAPALAVVLSLSVSACGTRESGAAAVVGDRRITVAQVQSAYQDILPLIGQDQQLDQAQILNLLILEPYLNGAASALGRGVSTTDAQLQVKAAANGEDLIFSRSGLAVWQANLANQALQQDRSQQEIERTYQDIGRRLRADGVDINPRYGTALDYSTFTITPEQPNWIARATPSAGASPGAPQAPQEAPAPQEEPAPGSEPSPEGEPAPEDEPSPEGEPTPEASPTQ